MATWHLKRITHLPRASQHHAHVCEGRGGSRFAGRGWVAPRQALGVPGSAARLPCLMQDELQVPGPMLGLCETWCHGRGQHGARTCTVHVAHWCMTHSVLGPELPLDVLSTVKLTRPEGGRGHTACRKPLLSGRTPGPRVGAGDLDQPWASEARSPSCQAAAHGSELMGDRRGTQCQRGLRMPSDEGPRPYTWSQLPIGNLGPTRRNGKFKK